MWWICFYFHAQNEATETEVERFCLTPSVVWQGVYTYTKMSQCPNKIYVKNEK